MSKANLGQGRNMFKIKLMVLAGVLFLLNGCTGTSAVTGTYQLLQTEKDLSQQTVAVTSRSIEYRILSQDRLRISLYKDPQAASEGSGGGLGQDMSGGKGLLVDAAGYVPLPLIGKVKVAGLTQTGAADHITGMYKKYLNTPSVYVEVLNKKIFVLGEVKSPGVKQLTNEKMTLFEALALSGDFTNAALKDQVIIVSNIPGKGMQMRTVDVTNFDTMNYASLMLRPNDIVYVRPNSWQEFKVGSSDVLSLLDPILKVVATYATFKYLLD
jgi:polysaccharide export outer membrane protein